MLFLNRRQQWSIAAAPKRQPIKKQYDQPKAAQQIIERTNSGVLVSVTQPINPSLTKGMNVYVEGTGSEARVVPQG